MRGAGVFVVFAGLTMASCGQAPQISQAESDDNQCRSYGVQPGSNAYVQCRMNLDNLHAQDLQSRRAVAAQMLLR